MTNPADVLTTILLIKLPVLIGEQLAPAFIAVVEL
jgi:hypothetical protein